MYVCGTKTTFSLLLANTQSDCSSELSLPFTWAAQDTTSRSLRKNSLPYLGRERSLILNHMLLMNHSQRLHIPPTDTHPPYHKTNSWAPPSCPEGAETGSIYVSLGRSSCPLTLLVMKTTVQIQHVWFDLVQMPQQPFILNEETLK